MNLYFAPLEGITSYIFRNAHSEMFGGCDSYFAPFVTPTDNEKLSIKNLRDILPEKNKNVNLKVQVLTNSAEAFFKFEEKVIKMGYDEVNLNFGCPSGTVVKKGRGAGFLRDRDALNRFLCEVTKKSRMKISVKTRIGYLDGDEMDELINIYNKYNFTNLIIHPRTRVQMYKGEPDMDVFKNAYCISKNRVCYNGNIFSKEDYNRITGDFPNIEGVMIGRGAIKNPAIFREINGGKKLQTKELIEFSKRLIDDYYAVLNSDLFTLYKLKEIWLYQMLNYPEEKKILKAIKKANKLSEFLSAIESLPEI